MVAELEGVASLTHNHGWRFGQGDLYVLVRMRATVIASRFAHSTERARMRCTAMLTRSLYTMPPRSPTRLRSTRPSSPTRGGCRPPTSRRASCRTASHSRTRRAEITPRYAGDRREMRPRRDRAPTYTPGVAAAVADDSERSPRDCDGRLRGVPPAGPPSGDAVHG